MDATDHDLLEQYLNEGNHRAFAELVRRYLPMVHAAALRLSGNSAPAEEISQAVMSKLARLRTMPPPSLSMACWMHRHTRSAAIDLLRSETRRHRRERLSVSLLPAVPQDEFPWNDIAPVLDEVIGGLPEGERDMVLRRYFQDQPHATIAASLGISEDAARMRLNRVLEKMRGLLGKRGITTTASALSLGLPAHAAMPLPSGRTGLVDAVSRTALATALPEASRHAILTIGISTMTSRTVILIAAAVVMMVTATGLALKPDPAHSPAIAAGFHGSSEASTGTRQENDRRPPPGSVQAAPAARKVRLSDETGPALPEKMDQRTLDALFAAGSADGMARATRKNPASEFLNKQLGEIRKAGAGLPEGREKELNQSLERAIQKRLEEVNQQKLEEWMKEMQERTKPPDPPSEGEITRYLEQSGRTPETLGWLFSRTGNLAVLREGLEKDPENPLLRFLAAAMPVKEDAGADTAVRTLSQTSSEWLRIHQPGLHAALMTGGQEGLPPSVLTDLNDASLSLLPEDTLQHQCREFLKIARHQPVDETLEDLPASADYPVAAVYRIRSRLLMVALYSSDPAAKAVATLALSRSSGLSMAQTGLEMERKLYQSMDDDALRNLMGDSRESLLSSVDAEIRDFGKLEAFRATLLASRDKATLENFHALRGKIGEKAALQQLSEAPPK